MRGTAALPSTAEGPVNGPQRGLVPIPDIPDRSQPARIRRAPHRASASAATSPTSRVRVTTVSRSQAPRSSGRPQSPCESRARRVSRPSAGTRDPEIRRQEGSTNQRNDPGSENYSCPVTGTVGTHLALKTSDGPIEVHVAAAKFLQDYGIHFTANDEIVMFGIKGSYQGSPAFLPRIIMVGNNTYFVRGADGKPLW